jgi:hypothetical protein
MPLKRRARALVALAPLFAAALAAAQSPPADRAAIRSAPRQRVTATFDGRRIEVDYGRPQRRGRPIFGGLVPYGEVWRTGADEATQLRTEADLLFAGGLFVPKGAYSLFILPRVEAWLLILNRAAVQWGAFNYDPAQDVGRVPLRRERIADPIEEFSIALQWTGERSGVLWLGWERTLLSIPFETLPEGAPPTSPPAAPPRTPASRSAE